MSSSDLTEFTESFYDSEAHSSDSIRSSESSSASEVSKEETEAYVEVIEFSIRDMGGNATAYTATSIEELRVRLAMQAGVLSPCILLFKRGSIIEDTHKIDQVFGNDMPPHEVDIVNNLEGAKKGVSDWIATKWIHAFKLHVRYGDQHVVHHAEPLITVDDGFREKMRLWVVDTIYNIQDIRTRKQADERLEDIKAAITLGIDVHVSNESGDTLLSRAAQYGYTELLHAILDAGGDVNVRDNSGHTPLHDAAVFGHAKVIRALIRAGANVDARTNDGYTPLQLARRKICERAIQGQ